jgi:hypothetical protein
MGPKDRKNVRKQGEKKVKESKLQRLTGDYTIDIIIGILFVSVLIPLIIAMFHYPDSSDKIITGMLSLLFALVGFYTGKKSHSE